LQLVNWFLPVVYFFILNACANQAKHESLLAARNLCEKDQDLTLELIKLDRSLDHTRTKLIEQTQYLKGSLVNQLHNLGHKNITQKKYQQFIAARFSQYDKKIQTHQQIDHQLFSYYLKLLSDNNCQDLIVGNNQLMQLSDNTRSKLREILFINSEYLDYLVKLKQVEVEFTKYVDNDIALESLLELASSTLGQIVD
jgi:hypothetical protein